MKRNCTNCKYLEWGFGDTNDPEGWECLKRDYYKRGNYRKNERKHHAQLDSFFYREQSKKCYEKKITSEALR